jgi:hypothetical protein
MTKSILPLITAMMLYGCAAGGLNTETESLPAPEWLLIPPHEEGFFYGIGGDSDLDVAKHKSIVDIGMQFSSRVVSALVAGTSIDEGDSVESVISLNEQITDQAVNGAKFCDQYRDEKGMYWVLSRVNTNCLLDVSESLILSYSLELEQEAGIQANALAGVLGTVEKTTNKPLYTLPKATSYERYGTFTPPIRTISVDGQSDDWAGIWEYYRDETDDLNQCPTVRNCVISKRFTSPSIGTSSI